MIPRPDYERQVRAALGRAPICALIGPRQCGKTTLARLIAAGEASTFFDLESPADRLRLQNPELALRDRRGLVVLDEVQVLPELFPVLRVLVDRPDLPARFLILGSASPELVAKTADSLAGRVEFVDLHGFDVRETEPTDHQRLWSRGGFPRSFLAASDEDSSAWREGFVRTFLERDLPQLGVRVPAPTLRRFWTMLAHWHGQTLNSSELGRALGVSDKTVRSYLDVLTQTFMVRQLLPWFENVSKRQVKSPKLYLTDSGLLHHLLGLGNSDELHGHPKVGASWEGFALEQVLRLAGQREAFFWGTQGGAELDLLLLRGGRRVGFEFKHTESPRPTRSMYIALDDLRLDRLFVVAPVNHRVTLDDRIEAAGLRSIVEILGE